MGWTTQSGEPNTAATLQYACETNHAPATLPVFTTSPPHLLTPAMFATHCRWQVQMNAAATGLLQSMHQWQVAFTCRMLRRVDALEDPVAFISSILQVGLPASGLLGICADAGLRKRLDNAVSPCHLFCAL